jgi:hypothetical protein
VSYLIPRSLSAVLDANGNGQVGFSIDNSNQQWVIDGVTVQTDSLANATPVPTATVYLNNIEPSGFHGGTYSGNLDTATGGAVLFDGDTLYVVWSGGIPGSKATATIHGQFTRAGEPI